MACSQTIAAYQLADCFSSKGGIKNVWLAVYAPSAYTMTTAGTVSGFATGTSWYKQELRRNQGSMTSTLNVNEESGLNEVQTDLNIVYSKMQKEERIQMNAISKGDFIAVVQDANNNYFALGAEEPCRATAGTGETGTAREDANRYSVTITDHAENWPPLLDSSAIEALS